MDFWASVGLFSYLSYSPHGSYSGTHGSSHSSSSGKLMDKLSDNLMDSHYKINSELTHGTHGINS